MKKFFLNVCLFTMFILVFTFQHSHAKNYEWRLSTLAPPTSFLGEGLTKFADLVEKKTEGKMKIRVGYSSAFGGWADSLKAVSMGSLEMTVEDVGRWEIANKNFRIASCLYAFDDWEHYLNWINSPSFQEETEKLAKSNYHVLIPNKRAVWKSSPYRVILSKRPIFSVSDYENLRIRTPEIALRVRSYRHFGATTSVIPFGEVYLALRQGMVDAVTMPLTQIYDMKFHEVAPYLTNINEFLQNHMITVDKRKWDSLPEDIKKAMEDAAVEVAEWSNNLMDQRGEEDLQKMLDEGAVFIRIGLSDFREKFRPLILEFENEGVWDKGLYEKIQSYK